MTQFCTTTNLEDPQWRCKAQNSIRDGLIDTKTLYIYADHWYYTNAVQCHHGDVIMTGMASQISGVSIVFSAVCSGTDQRKHHSSASVAFVRGIHRGPVISPRTRPVTRKMFPFDDVIMYLDFSNRVIPTQCLQ